MHHDPPTAASVPETRRNGTLHILLAEDNEDHARITERSLRQSQPEVRERLVITKVGDGEQALAAMRASILPNGASTGLTPDLLLLDLKMPGMGGLDVLRAMREDERLRTVPVVVLTTSARDEDILEAYRLGANEYVTKPVEPEDFRRKVQSIPAYWSQVVQRPPRPDGEER